MPKKIPWHVIANEFDGRPVYVSSMKELPNGNTAIDFTHHIEHARLYQSAGSATRDAQMVVQATGRKTTIMPIESSLKTRRKKNPGMKYPARKPKYKFQEPKSEYKYRRVKLRRQEAKKKKKRPPFLTLQSQGTRDAIYDYRRGYRDPDYPMSHFEDHTYATAYRAAMKKMIERKGK